jgi:hypothetical protein
MPDHVDELFNRLGGVTLPVPDVAGVVGRGRQRRRRFRYLVAAAALAAIVVVAGSVAAITHGLAGTGGTTPPAGPHRTRPSGQPMPAGTGQLMLGVTNAGAFELGRAGRAALEPLGGIRPPSGGQPLIATDPAGGWVVTGAAGSDERLATVSPAGQVQPFGPVFDGAPVTSIAVAAHGSAVAVALATTPVSTAGCRCQPARIDLLPLPGHQVRSRSWTLSTATRTMAIDLSWGPDGTSLTYVPGANEDGGGFSGHGAVTLDTSRAGTIAPAVTAWPPFRKGAVCNMIGGTWAGGQYLALEACGGPGEHMELVPASAADGAVAGAPVRVQGWGCAVPTLSVGAGNRVLVNYCGAQARNGSAYRDLPSALAQAAWTGVIGGASVSMAA